MSAPMQMGDYEAPQSQAGDRVQARDLVDHTLLVLVQEKRWVAKTKHAPDGGWAVFCDVWDLITGQVYCGAMFMGAAVVDGLARYAGDGLVRAVKFIWTASQGGGTTYISVASASDAEKAMASQAAMSYPNLFNDTRTQRGYGPYIAGQGALPPEPPQQQVQAPAPGQFAPPQMGQPGAQAWPPAGAPGTAPQQPAQQFQAPAPAPQQFQQPAQQFQAPAATPAPASDPYAPAGFAAPPQQFQAPAPAPEPQQAAQQFAPAPQPQQQAAAPGWPPQQAQTPQPQAAPAPAPQPAAAPLTMPPQVGQPAPAPAPQPQAAPPAAPPQQTAAPANLPF